MEQPPSPRGRPRSADARSAILAATQDLLREAGYEGLAIVDIAARANVGKQTIYRWWASKAAIVTECVLEGFVDLPLITVEATGDPAADLRAWLAASFSVVTSADAAPLLRALNAAAATDPAASDEMSTRFSGPLRSAIRATLNAGIEAGTVRVDVDPAVIADLLVGTMIAAVVTRDPHAADRTDAIVETVFAGIARR